MFTTLHDGSSADAAVPYFTTKPSAGVASAAALHRDPRAPVTVTVTAASLFPPSNSNTVPPPTQHTAAAAAAADDDDDNDSLDFSPDWLRSDSDSDGGDVADTAASASDTSVPSDRNSGVFSLASATAATAANSSNPNAAHAAADKGVAAAESRGNLTAGVTGLSSAPSSSSSQHSSGNTHSGAGGRHRHERGARGGKGPQPGNNNNNNNNNNNTNIGSNRRNDGAFSLDRNRFGFNGRSAAPRDGADALPSVHTNPITGSAGAPQQQQQQQRVDLHALASQLSAMKAGARPTATSTPTPRSAVNNSANSPTGNIYSAAPTVQPPYTPAGIITGNNNSNSNSNNVRNASSAAPPAAEAEEPTVQVVVPSSMIPALAGLSGPGAPAPDAVTVVRVPLSYTRDPQRLQALLASIRTVPAAAPQQQQQQQQQAQRQTQTPPAAPRPSVVPAGGFPYSNNSSNNNNSQFAFAPAASAAPSVTPGGSANSYVAFTDANGNRVYMAAAPAAQASGSYAGGFVQQQQQQQQQTTAMPAYLHTASGNSQAPFAAPQFVAYQNTTAGGAGGPVYSAVRHLPNATVTGANAGGAPNYASSPAFISGGGGAAPVQTFVLPDGTRVMAVPVTPSGTPSNGGAPYYYATNSNTNAAAAANAANNNNNNNTTSNNNGSNGNQSGAGVFPFYVTNSTNHNAAAAPYAGVSYTNHGAQNGFYSVVGHRQ